jgi:hypothetical protein
MAGPDAGDNFSVVFDTVRTSTQVTEYLITAPDYSLVTGSVYRFRVKAFNFNGPSTESAVTSVQACGMPSGISKPVKVSANTATPSITI